MSAKNGVSRRGFFGGLAAAIGVIGLRPETLWAQARAAVQQFRAPWKTETNFFMVDLGRPIGPARDEFQKRGVLVGRDFPPLLNHLRVSVGTAEEMDRFLAAFQEIFPQGNAPTAG